jgi:hypothetical protein
MRSTAMVAALDFADDLVGGRRNAAGIEREDAAWPGRLSTRSVTITSSRWKLLRTARDAPNSRMAAAMISREDDEGFQESLPGSGIG